MSTTPTHNMTPQVEALLSAQLCEKYVDENGHTVVFFDLPCMADAAAGGSYDERLESFKHAIAQSVIYAEWRSVMSSGFTSTVHYSTKVLATATIVPVLNITKTEVIKIGTSAERRKYTIVECFPVMAADGKVVRGASGYWYHETVEKAAATMKKWTKTAAEFDRDMAFIDEHREAIDALAGRTTGAAAPGAETKVGDTVVVWGHNKARIGIVSEVSKTRVKVAWNTPSGVKQRNRPIVNWHKKS